MNNTALYLIESGICLALFYIVYRAFLKKETFFSINRFFLLLSIPISFFIPLLKIPSPFPARPLIEKTYVAEQPAGTQIQYPGTSDVLWLIFLVGAGLFLLRFLYKLIQLFILIKKYGFQKLNGVNVVFINKNSAPFSFFNFLFVNKSDISKQDFNRIIAHELVHIKQYHSIDLIFMELLTIFQWFNPFVWPYKKSLKETHEYLADNAVIAQGCSKAKYQVLIFEQHVGMKLFEFANNFNHSQIKRRITMMEKIKSRGRAKFKVLLILPIIALLMLAFAESRPAKAPDETDNSDKVMLSQDDSKVTAQTEEQKKAEEEKKKKKEMEEKKKEELLKKEKKLKEMLEKTEDPEKRKALEKKLEELYMMKKVEKKKKEMEIQYLELKKKLETTEDPEEKALIKKKLAKLEEIKEAEIRVKKISMKEKELKEAYSKTDDPEKKKLIKEKLAKLQKMKKEEQKEIFEKQYVPIMIAELKDAYKKTDDPEKRAEIKKKIEMLKKAEEKEKIGKEKSYEQKELELKEKLKNTEDPEKRKLIQKKLAELEKMKEEQKKKESKKD
jgi:hypothetical protein